MSEFLPTHNCFDDAMLFFIQLGVERTPQTEIDEYVLVHGICLAPDETPYVHAWVEHADGFVVQAGVVEGAQVFVRFDRAEFFEAWRVQDFTVYTLNEMIDACERSRRGTSGPWLPKYLKMQNDQARRRTSPRKWNIGHTLEAQVGTFNTQTGKFEGAS